MRWLEVKYSNPLQGSIKIPGSKNSSLGLLAACCLSDGPVFLHNVPDIRDIKVACDIGRDIGMDIKRNGDCLIVDPRSIHSSYIDPQKSAAFRTAYYFIGSLIAKHKKVCVGYPGGDNIGPRPIDQHIKGLRALGVHFTFHDHYYIAEASSLTGTDIYFDVVTSGATINVMLAAVLAKGKTVLYNAARDPEIVDIAILLNKMGARIYGAGTNTIRIIGVSQLGGCTHSVIPDRLIAGGFLVGAGVTGGTVTVEDVIPEHLESCMEKLSEIGVHIHKTANSITASGNAPLKGTIIKTGMYPAFPSDLQQPFTTLLLKAIGNSTITERIFPQRFDHCIQLNRMGANITLQDGTAYIKGNAHLFGSWVHATDIRAGTALILAGLIAENTTYITGLEHIERGYENVVKDFSSLGADLRVCEDQYEKEASESPLIPGHTILKL